GPALPASSQSRASNCRTTCSARRKGGRPMLILAALCAGGFATTAVLWFAGVGSNGTAAAARLSRIRESDLPATEERKIGLRRRGAVNFAGITVISGNLAANWTRDLERAGLTLNAKEYFVLRVL